MIYVHYFKKEFVGLMVGNLKVGKCYKAQIRRVNFEISDKQNGVKKQKRFRPDNFRLRIDRRFYSARLDVETPPQGWPIVRVQTLYIAYAK